MAVELGSKEINVSTSFSFRVQEIKKCQCQPVRQKNSIKERKTMPLSLEPLPFKHKRSKVITLTVLMIIYFECSCSCV